MTDIETLEALARAERHEAFVEVDPDVVLALIDRVRKAEALLLRSRTEVAMPGTDIDDDIHAYLVGVGLPSTEWQAPSLKGAAQAPTGEETNDGE